MYDPVSIVLVGIGGHGAVFVRALLESDKPGKFHIAGVVDPYPETSPHISNLKAQDIPLYTSLEDFYARKEADLAVIASPIQYHCSQTCLALSKGSNVLCEKPLSATVEQGKTMIRAREQEGAFLAIGYNWSYSDATQRLKRDIQSGLFGRPVRFKTLVLRPRDHEYFSRSWAGLIKDSNGRWVLDSVANNSTAHFLHNMFYVLGETTTESALPKQVTAELYRANDIENFDTAAVKAITQDEVELFFYTTHAINEKAGPVYRYEFEKAAVEYEAERGTIKAVCRDGTTIDYGNPTTSSAEILWQVIDGMRNDIPPVCGAEAAFSHTLCIHGMHQSVPEIVDFPEEITREDGHPPVTWIRGLGDVFRDCYKRWRLPAEAEISWARMGKPVDLETDFF